MSAPQYTPGPWTCGESSEFGVDVWKEGGTQYICRTIYAATEEVQHANAQLIAAAPDMLHALELAAAELDKMGCDDWCDKNPLNCPVCAVHEALAKATGKTND